MLAEHLDDRHDLASRQRATIDAHVRWLAQVGPAHGQRVLDLGCGPGLYLERFASMGWSCVGVDIAPAAIEYAENQAAQTGAQCEYLLGDFRDAHVDGSFDLVLCLFGELSTVPLADVWLVIERVGRWLTSAGRAVIELSTRAGVRKKGERPSSWYAATGGLFADGEHVVLPECAWIEPHRASVERWWVIDPSSNALQMLGSTTWWHGPRIGEALAAAGLVIEDRYGDLSGAPQADDDDFESLVLRRFTSTR
jgi:SAM-dependent methyltransferase